MLEPKCFTKEIQLSSRLFWSINFVSDVSLQILFEKWNDNWKIDSRI